MPGGIAVGGQSEAEDYTDHGDLAMTDPPVPDPGDAAQGQPGQGR
ncbi:hypothetical protein [Paenarthrobacter sp. FR1]